MVLFPLPPQPYFTMQTLNLSRCPWWVKCGSVDRKAYCVKKERLHGPREFSISNFHIPCARHTVQRPLRDSALFLLQSPLSPLRSVALRCCRWWERPKRFWMATQLLVETKIKTENNFQALSFGETLPGHILLVQSSYMSVTDWLFCCDLANVGFLLCCLSDRHFSLDCKYRGSRVLFQHCYGVLLDYWFSTTNKLFDMLYVFFFNRLFLEQL